jgi:ATP-dependent Clp protease ATP-binding subunit ClpA
MSEYMERHTVSRLIGAPPGYVGFDQGGLLTDAIDKNPHTVLLLDEIEKAHPDLFNILLQVMDYGKMTDHNGKSVDFRNVVLLMTTNLGSRDMEKAPVGFQREMRESEDDEEIKKFFSPEFRNRLDGIIKFNRLDDKTIDKILDKFLDTLALQLSKQSIGLEVSEEARGWLKLKGFDPVFGARPVDRVIKKFIRTPLADKLLEIEEPAGSTVHVGLLNDELSIEVVEETVEENVDA